MIISSREVRRLIVICPGCRTEYASDLPPVRPGTEVYTYEDQLRAEFLQRGWVDLDLGSGLVCEKCADKIRAHFERLGWTLPKTANASDPAEPNSAGSKEMREW
jgi:hypothetical protein